MLKETRQNKSVTRDMDKLQGGTKEGVATVYKNTGLCKITMMYGSDICPGCKVKRIRNLALK